MDVKEEIVECHDMVVEETIEVTTHESPVKTQQPKQEAVSLIVDISEIIKYTYLSNRLLT
jgi:hypothetical protein